MAEISGLLYVPILHTQAEAGEILISLKGGEGKRPTSNAASEREISIKEMWEGIHEKVQESGIVYSSFRIYQDALPVCGKEEKIVRSLAQRGSRNHQLILELVEKGAKLEGTEDPDLLIKEHDYLTQLLGAVSISLQSYKDTFQEYKEKSVRLMKERDAFIAERIRSTIRKDEIPLVFMGVRHQLERLLKRNFVINYVIYRLPFKKVKDIYNV